MGFGILVLFGLQGWRCFGRKLIDSNVIYFLGLMATVWVVWIWGVLGLVDDLGFEGSDILPFLGP